MNSLSDAFASFVHALKTRYGVSRLIVTGGGIGRFGTQFLNATLRTSCLAAGITFDISLTPGLSALGGALLLAIKDLEAQGEMWRRRVKEFVYRQTNRQLSCKPS